MAVTGTFAFSWPIPCANWSNLSEFSNVKTLTVNSNEMWKPLIMHYNSAINYYLNPEEMALPFVVVHSEAAVSFIVGIFTSKCEFHFKQFPFDSQKCEIILESFQNSEYIVLRPNAMLHYPQNDIVGDYVFDYSKVDFFTKNHTANFSYAKYEFHFSRKCEYYIINIILPTISMMALEHAALFIPISSERCSFLLTILLSIFLIQSVVDGKISHLSETPRLAYLLLGFTVSSTVLCLYSIVMLALLKKITREKQAKFIQGLDGIVFILSIISSVAMAAFTFQENL